jgi:hypothetical protein
MEMHHVRPLLLQDLSELPGSHCITVAIELPQVLYPIADPEPSHWETTTDVPSGLPSGCYHDHFHAPLPQSVREGLHVHFCPTHHIRAKAKRHLNSLNVSRLAGALPYRPLENEVITALTVDFDIS